MVTQNAERNRFEIESQGQTGFLDYRLAPDSITLVHTEVPPELEGQGLGGKLARAGLDYAAEHHLKVIPLCPFVKDYMERHR